jgi:hypothetical protein
MGDLVAEQVADLRARLTGASVHPQPDGTRVLELPDVSLPVGWSLERTSVWVVLPIGYPQVQPDCFFASAELTLANGAAPASSGIQQLLGRPMRWFSWHLQAWDPLHDGLAQFVRFVERRLADPR